jgi:hypothetical protein
MRIKTLTLNRFVGELNDIFRNASCLNCLQLRTPPSLCQADIVAGFRMKPFISSSSVGVRSIQNEVGVKTVLPTHHLCVEDLLSDLLTFFKFDL